MTRRASLPIDIAAATAADTAVREQTHPPGRPLDPADPRDAPLREAWMDAYAQAGGAIEPPSSGAIAGEPVLPCPAALKPTDLEFRRVYADGTPIAGIPYSVTLADGSVRKGSCDASGLAQLAGVEPGSAQVTYGLDPNPPQASITMEADPDLLQLLRFAG